MYYINIHDKSGKTETIYTYRDTDSQLVETICAETQDALCQIGLICSYSCTCFYPNFVIDAHLYDEAVKIFRVAIAKFLKERAK